MKHYLITWHETDGNDCVVYDTVIAADSAELAFDTLRLAVETDYRGLEDDGSEFGYYFECNCPEGSDCDGHGGLSLRDIQEFDTRAAAENQCSIWHVRFDVEPQT